MLTRTLFSTMKSQYERVIDTLGVPMSWTHIKSGLTLSVIGGIKIAGNEDIAIVNAYGIGARIITVKASSFPTTHPEKFDKFVVGSETYIIENVSPVHFNGELVGYRVFTKGR